MPTTPSPSPSPNPSPNRWIAQTERNPEHSTWYVERFGDGDAADHGERRYLTSILPLTGNGRGEST